MPDTRAVVLLHQLGLPDDLPYRSLKFKSDSDQVDIGRASKRENKNLAPARHNGLFDSRVMSRAHATMSVSLEKKELYIRDPGSMHGTWLNQTKIPVNENAEIKSGDVLTFGVEVVRGTDTFPPLAVRCECQWLESPYATWELTDGNYADPTDSDLDREISNQTTNTFCVPDDDEECEIGHESASVNIGYDHGTNSNDSAGCSDSEDSRSVVLVSSIVTSPVKIDAPKDVQFIGSATRSNGSESSGSEQNPIDLGREQVEQPLVTPRMTPPSPLDSSADQEDDIQYYAEYFGQSSDEDSISESENWGEEGEEGEVEEEEREADEIRVGLEDELAAELPKPDAESPNSIMNKITLPKAAELIQTVTDCEIQGPDAGGSVEERPLGESGKQKLPDHSSNDQPVPNQPDFPTMTGSTVGFNPRHMDPPVSTDDSCVHKSNHLPWSLPDKPAASTGIPQHPSVKLYDHTLAAFTNQYTPMPPEQPGSVNAYPKYPPYGLIQLQDPCAPHAPYNDGPFASDHSVMGSDGTSACKATTGSNVQHYPFMDPLTPLLPRMHRTSAPAAGPLPPIMHVDSRPLKRKAMEMDADVSGRSPPSTQFQTFPPAGEAPPPGIQNTAQRETEDSCLPDAQPQSLAVVSNNSDSQLTALSIPSEERSQDTAQESERPPKRAKTSNGVNFRSHAATAVLGAVVGAVGTIAALASLPSDYFV